MSQTVQNFVNKIEKKDVFLSLGGVTLGLVGGVILKNKLRTLLGKLGLVSQNSFSGVNKPTAGARHESQLPKGKHPLQLYSLGTPNGQKVTILLEELGVKYDAYVISIMKGDQFGSGFVKINPNSKIPALVDYSEDSEQGVNVFESGNILLYLAEKQGKLIPSDPIKKTECLNWLFMQMGSAPYFGQLGHFKNYCPKGVWYDHSYSFERYKLETQRICSVLDQALQGKQYLCGDDYTIADIAWYPWINCLGEYYKVWELLNMEQYTNLVRWFNSIKSRPATKKGMSINQPWNKEGYGEYHSDE